MRVVSLLLAGSIVSGCSVFGGISIPRQERGRDPGIMVSVVVGDGAGVTPKARYRGRLEEVAHEGRTLLVNHVSLEDYVRGVLPGEVPPLWPEETLKAIAVVTRTYAWQKWKQRAGKSYHLLSDTRDQMYCGRSCEDPRSSTAVNETRGLILLKDGEPVQAFAHSCCAGATEAVQEVWGGGPISFLGGVKCRGCIGSRHYGPWTLIIERATLARLLASRTGGAKNVWRVRIEERNRSGRVKTVGVSVGKRVVRLSGATFRSLVGYNDLRSTRFEIVEREDAVVFNGTGWGHGVGICQEGSCAMAREGKTYQEILAHYFPGTTLGRARE